jgi:hypothetical protein
MHGHAELILKYLVINHDQNFRGKKNNDLNAPFRSLYGVRKLNYVSVNVPIDLRTGFREEYTGTQEDSNYLEAGSPWIKPWNKTLCLNIIR